MLPNFFYFIWKNKLHAQLSIYVSLMSFDLTLFIHHLIGHYYTCGCLYNHENYNDVHILIQTRTKPRSGTTASTN